MAQLPLKILGSMQVPSTTPFQGCYVHMQLREFDQETTMLVPDTLEMLSDLELTQYYIKDWHLEYFNPGSKKD